MTDRDHFAAAALTGLLYPEVDDEFAMPYIVGRAYLWADAMLRERPRTNLDAAPAAIAPEPEPEPAARRLPAGGTGGTDHGASPEARASVGRPRTDKADLPTRAGTGDTPRPISGCVSDRPKPIASEQEPVAWAVMLADGERIYDVYATEEEAKAIDEAVTGNHGVVPLYRSPTLTDAEREAIERGYCSLMGVEDMSAECTRWNAEAAAVLRGLLERLGGGR